MARDSRGLRIQSVHHAVSVSTAASSPEGGESVVLNLAGTRDLVASMKVPARRRGNCPVAYDGRTSTYRLNESPLPKAGKWARVAGEVDAMRKTPHLKSPARKRGNAGGDGRHSRPAGASMKVPA